MWEYIPFENCLEKTKIKFKLPKKDYKESGKYPIVSQEESLINGYHNDISYIFKVAKPIVVFGDHTLALKYIDFDFIVGADGVKILQPKETINPKYFYYVLKALVPKTTGYARHYKLLKKLDIPVPPLAEQEHIVAKLDAAFAEIDEVVEEAKINLANNNMLVSASLGKIFDNEKDQWDAYTLNDLCIVERGSSPRPIKNFITEEGGVNWVKIGDTSKDGKYVTSTRQRITKEGAEKSRYVNVGDFILTNSMSYGRPYIMAIDGCIHDGWFVLRLNGDIDVEYFFYLLSSPFVQNQFKQLAAGSVVKNISGDLIKKTKIPLPTKERQIEIRKKIIKIEKQTEESYRLQTLKIENLLALKSAILKQELQSSEAA